MLWKQRGSQLTDVVLLQVQLWNKTRISYAWCSLNHSRRSLTATAPHSSPWTHPTVTIKSIAPGVRSNHTANGKVAQPNYALQTLIPGSQKEFIFICGNCTVHRREYRRKTCTIPSSQMNACLKMHVFSTRGPSIHRTKSEPLPTWLALCFGSVFSQSNRISTLPLTIYVRTNWQTQELSFFHIFSEDDISRTLERIQT